MMKKVLLVLAVLALLVSLPATVAAKSDGGTKHRGAPARVVDKDKAAKDKTAKDGAKLKAGPEKPEKEKPAKEEKAKKACATIQSGQILSGDGSVIETGYDGWGYNCRARRFHGAYGDAGAVVDDDAQLGDRGRDFDRQLVQAQIERQVAVGQQADPVDVIGSPQPRPDPAEHGVLRETVQVLGEALVVAVEVAD